MILLAIFLTFLAEYSTTWAFNQQLNAGLKLLLLDKLKYMLFHVMQHAFG